MEGYLLHMTDTHHNWLLEILVILRSWNRENKGELLNIYKTSTMFWALFTDEWDEHDPLLSGSHDPVGKINRYVLQFRVLASVIGVNTVLEEKRPGGEWQRGHLCWDFKD